MSTNATPHLRNIPITGREHVPADGVLVTPSQLNHLDLLHLKKVLEGRAVALLLEQGAVLAPLMQMQLQGEDSALLTVPADLDDWMAFAQRVRQLIAAGTVLIYVPEQVFAQPVSLTMVEGRKLETLMSLGVPVLPLYVQRGNEVLLAVDGEGTEDDGIFAFGPVLRGEGLTVAAYQEILLGLNEAVFSANPRLNRNLAYVLLMGLKKHGTTAMLVDGKDEKEFGYDKVLAAAIVLSRHVRSVTGKARVGIVMPPGMGGLVANLAVLFAGKVPVNLNFTAGRASVDSAMRQAEMDHYLTADLFVRKMQTFPWPPNRQMTFLERWLPSKKGAIARWYVLSKMLPAPVLASVLGIPRKGGNQEALLLFTSGSSGEPKGVALTHRNVLANVTQFGSRLNMKHNDGILGCLPLFHSFGCTVTLWFPIIQGVNLISYPSPLEVKKLAELMHRYKVTLFVTTPTFLRGYLKGVNPELLTSLKLVVTGAEKLPKTVAEAFQARFGKPVLEGYGLTETSPATNVNLPDPGVQPALSPESYMPSYRFGSVGQLLPGLALRITDINTDEPRSLHDSGMIWLKGANVFNGYLKNPKKSQEVLKDGWFRTGDIGRLDEDGFLYVEGRLSRFSKVGGEMVPHETVEEALVKALNLENEATRRIAVVGVPDEDKGEALVLLSSVPGGSVQQEILDLRYKLLDRGMPALWIPKKMIRVQEIPILSSGKLDVKGCEKLVSGK